MKWTNTTDSLPPEGITVMALSNGGMQQALKRQGNLWFLPNDGMCVYYQVAMWRYLEREEY